MLLMDIVLMNSSIKDLYRQFEAEPEKYTLVCQGMDSRFFDKYYVYEVDALDSRNIKRLYCKIVVKKSQQTSKRLNFITCIRNIHIFLMNRKYHGTSCFLIFNQEIPQ